MSNASNGKQSNGKKLIGKRIPASTNKQLEACNA